MRKIRTLKEVYADPRVEKIHDTRSEWGIKVYLKPGYRYTGKENITGSTYGFVFNTTVSGILHSLNHWIEEGEPSCKWR